MSTRKIITEHIYPSIPIRQFDWSAHWDGDEPNDDGHMHIGYGVTETEAIADLCTCDCCGERGVDNLFPSGSTLICGTCADEEEQADADEDRRGEYR